MPASRPRPDPIRARLPLVAGKATRGVAWREGRVVRRDEFLADVQTVAAQLPVADHVVNLCADRYRFLVAFCAALTRGQASLLPPSRAPQAVAEVLAAHPGSYTLGEKALSGLTAVHVAPRLGSAPEPTAHVAVPMIPADQVAAIGYTSGSSGRPTANVKTWGSLAVSTAGNLTMLRRHLHEPFQVLATVPAQHMYGMETSILLPLFGDVGVHAGQPLLPGDVADALAQLPMPRVLATTPVHLRALVASGQGMPPLAAMVSATAPMPEELARAAEDRFAAPLLEVFGSTETCVFATRRSCREASWSPYPGVRVQPCPDGTRIEAPQLAEPVVLADLVEVDDAGRFRLLGRQSDFLDMAGKRASLADLNRRLRAVDGVEDGVLFPLDQADPLGVCRLAALVVAPDRSEAEILAALRAGMDPVFVPRPLRRVARLPRNATGKLPRAALLSALRRQ